jgi:poly-gamma-glutamate synthesis protein (capsule biosynthesis protein)
MDAQRLFGAKNICVSVIFILLVAGLLAGVMWGKQERSVTSPAPSFETCRAGLHGSYLVNRSFFDQAYEAMPAEPTMAKDVAGVIVNHHLLAPHLIAKTISALATTSPVTAVLVSPNHFGAGQGQIIASRYNWQTPYGVLKGDCAAVDTLARKGVAAVEELPFEKEHGVSGIVPFIKHSLPNARVLPVIVKDTLSETELLRFVEELSALFGNTAVLVGSFDFSHDLYPDAARFHDAKSLAVVRSFDYHGIHALDIDSMPGLEILLRYMERKGARQFDLVAHASSAELLGKPDQTDTTSYIDGTFSRGGTGSDSTVTALFFGDMMLDRAVRKEIDIHGARYPFKPLQRFLIGSDIVAANAEGPFTDNPSKTTEIGSTLLQFTFDPTLLPVLKKLGFTALGQANNHTLDFGHEGLATSRTVLTDAGLSTFGDSLNRDPLSYSATVRGQKVTLAGYHDFAGGIERVIEEVRSAKASGAFVAVFAHWGIEYDKEPSVRQRERAHAFIDAGADVIIGAHPHVIQPVEVYRGKAIFYSLGNFIFDQYFSKETSEGLAIGMVRAGSRVSFTLFPLDIRQGQASLMPPSRRAIVLHDIAAHSIVPPDVRTEIAKGVFTLSR